MEEIIKEPDINDLLKVTLESGQIDMYEALTILIEPDDKVALKRLITLLKNNGKSKE